MRLFVLKNPVEAYVKERSTQRRSVTGHPRLTSVIFKLQGGDGGLAGGDVEVGLEGEHVGVADRLAVGLLPADYEDGHVRTCR